MLSFVLALIAAGTATLAPTEVVERVNAANARLRSWQADFVERRHFVHFDQTETRSGRISFQRDVGLRIELHEPSPEVIVVRRNEARQWQPSTRQLHIYDLGDKKLSSDRTPIPVSIGDGSWDPAAANDLAVLDGDDSAVVLELTPHADTVYQKKVIWLDPSTWLPRRLKLVEVTDDVVHYSFSDVVIDGEIEPAMFDLEAPEGAEIVRHEELPSF